MFFPDTIYRKLRIINIKKMEKHPKKERSFVIIKPDGVQRSMIGEIISRIEKQDSKSQL